MKASECKCVECGEKAVAFYPADIDPDIPSLPYCRKCLDRVKLEVMIKIFGKEDGTNYFNMYKSPLC